MMFPFAFTLYSQRVQQKLDAAGSDLPAALRRRYGYEFGYKTVLNVLGSWRRLNLPQHVQEAGELFAKLLNEGLAICGNVREVRVHGLLIGIELDASRLAALVVPQEALFVLPLQHAAPPRFSGAGRLLPVRAERAEDHAGA